MGLVSSWANFLNFLNFRGSRLAFLCLRAAVDFPTHRLRPQTRTRPPGPGTCGKGKRFGSRSGGPGEGLPSSCPYLRRLLPFGFNAALERGIGFSGPIDRLPSRAYQVVSLEIVDPLPAQDLPHELETRLELRLHHFIGSPRGEAADVAGAGSTDDDVDGRVERTRVPNHRFGGQEVRRRHRDGTRLRHSRALQLGARGRISVQRVDAPIAQ